MPEVAERRFFFIRARTAHILLVTLRSIQSVTCTQVSFTLVFHTFTHPYNSIILSSRDHSALNIHLLKQE